MGETAEFNFSIPEGLPPSARAEDGILRVLVITMGDVMHTINTLPLIKLLSMSFEDIYIGVITTNALSDLLTTYVSIDQVHALDENEFNATGLLTGFAGAKELGRGFVDTNYTVVFDATSSGASANFTRASSIPLRIGFAPPVGQKVQRGAYTHRVLPGNTDDHIATRVMSMAKTLGVETKRPEFDSFELGGADVKIATLEARNYIVLDVTTPDDRSLWPDENYGELASTLSKTYNCDIVLTANSNIDEINQTRFREISERSSARCHMATDFSPVELAVLTRDSIAVFGPNNAQCHLASALGAPTVAFVGAQSANASLPIGAENIAIALDAPSSTPEFVAQEFAALWRGIVEEPLRGASYE